MEDGPGLDQEASSSSAVASASAAIGSGSVEDERATARTQCES